MKAFVAALLFGLAVAPAAAGECFPGPADCAGLVERDHRYGASAAEALDLYAPVGGATRALVVFVHGGGFVGGDKSSLWPGLITTLLARQVAVASVNYRMAPAVRYPQPMLDVARAVAFLRGSSGDSRASANPLVLSGSSAGGGIALWIALRSEPAVGRVAGVIAVNAQTTYDPEEITAVFETRRYPGFLRHLFGVTASELSSRDPVLRERFRDASPSAHLSAGDPPVVLMYTTPDLPPPPDAAPAAYLHHVRFGEFLKRKGDAVGADVRVRSRVGGRPGSGAFNQSFVQELDRILDSGPISATVH